MKHALRLMMPACALLASLAMACANGPDSAASAEAPAAASANPAAGQGEAVVTAQLRFEVLLQGSNSRAEEESIQVVRDARAFANLWRTLASFSAPVPDVDFDTRAILAAFMGKKRTGGYSIGVSKVEALLDGTVRVTLRSRSPGPDDIVTQAFTSPFAVVVLDAPKDAPIIIAYED